MNRVNKQSKQKIAVTGGIGSGKSTVCEILKSHGYPVFSCDAIYGELQLRKEYIRKLKEAFPNAVKEGAIDKKILSAVVFENPAELKRLNAISHPLIMQELNSRMEKSSSRLVFAEVPLLFEGGYQNLFDRIIVVSRGEKTRISSVIRRDGLTETDVKKRIKNQFDYSNLKTAVSPQDLSKIRILKNEGDFLVLEKNLLELIDFE